MTSTDVQCSGLQGTKMVKEHYGSKTCYCAYSVVSGGETASELLQPDTGLLQHVRVLMALKLQVNVLHTCIMGGTPR